MAISVFLLNQTDKSEIATQGDFCHREARSHLGCPGLANSQKRDCRAALAMTRILCHREARSDLGFLGLANSQKRDCRAALASIRHREARSDLGCPGLANSQKRDCRAALAMTLILCHREERSDLAFVTKITKKKIAALRSQPPKGALTVILCHRQYRCDSFLNFSMVGERHWPS
jgi:hypothetical protein